MRILGRVLELDIPTRRVRVAQLYAAGLTTYEVADELGFCQATIAKDVKALGIGRTASPPRKYPVPAERACARQGCSEHFTPAASAVAKGHGRYCSRRCARADQGPTQPPRGVELECDGWRNDGTRTSPKWVRCRRRIWRENSRIARSQHYYCSHQCAGSAKWRLDEGVVSRSLRESLEARGLWSTRATKRDSRRFGQRGASAGIAGLEHAHKGGARVQATEDQKREMDELLLKGLTTKEIALKVFGEERLFMRVQRHRKRTSTRK